MIPLKDENPTESFPYVTVILIAINTAIFIYQLIAGRAFTLNFALIPHEIFSKPGASTYFKFISSMFLHGSFTHLFGNMLFLWVFGDNIEDVLGKMKYIVFYFICGIVAGLAYAFTNMTSTTPTLGASGAISGILGAYIVLFPQTKILTLVPIFFFIRLIWIPAVFFLAVWFIFQLLFAFNSQSMGIAFLAHIGGFIAGFLLIRIFIKQRPSYQTIEEEPMDDDLWV